MAEARAHQQAAANANARNARRRDGNHAIERRMLEHERELESIFDDGVLAIVRNPRLRIAQEIEALGRSLAPRDSTVQVTIDRFTDFDVTIQLPAEKSPDEMAAICARLMEYDAKYLHRIRFYAERRLIGELDPSARSNAIASSATDEALLAEALEKSVTTSSTPAYTKDSSATFQGMSEEHDALGKVIEEWNASVDSHFRAVNQVITGLCDCVDLSTLKTKDDLSERLKKVESFTDLISIEQAYFARAVDSLRERIKGNDPLVISIIMRQVRQREESLLRQTKPLLFDVITLQSHVRELLENLDSHRNEWKLADRNQIEFTTTSAHVKFNVRNSEVVESVQRVTKRLRAMNEAAASSAPHNEL